MSTASELQPAGVATAAGDFRQNPVIVGLLRLAISRVAFSLPGFDDPTFQLLLAAYRKAKGERSYDIKISMAKQELDAHSAQFRSRYAAVLGSCLHSQLDRLLGRANDWPAFDGDAPDIVPDAVIERRLAIDELNRLVDIDAEDGFRAFDPLLFQALGRAPMSLRDNPMRPAVFFHALGLCWTQASGSDRHEPLVLQRFAPQIAPRIAAVYPELTAKLREALGVQKRAVGLPSRSPDGSTYSRLGAGAMAPSPLADAASGAASDRKPPQTGVRTADERRPPETDARVVLEQIVGRFEPVLCDDRLSAAARLRLSRLQLPLARLTLAQPQWLEDPGHPLSALVQELLDPAHWSTLAAAGSEPSQTLLDQLDLIAELLKRQRSHAQQDLRLFAHVHAQLRQCLGPAAPAAS